MRRCLGFTSFLRGVAWGLLIGVLGLVSPLPLLAQPEACCAASDRLGPWVPPPRVLWEDAVGLATAPASLSSEEWELAAGATGLLIGIAAVVDEPAYRHLSTREGQGGEAAARRATASLARPGEWYDRQKANPFALTTVGVLAGSGLLLQRPVLTRTAVRTLEAIVYTDLANGLVKSVLNRTRPYAGAEPDAFAGAPGTFTSAHTQLAFPSGHAARVFALASVLSHQADRWYVSVPLYASASSVALERVRSGDHWLTDVMVGSAIGYAVGRAVTGRSEPAGRASPRVRYGPILANGEIGVALQF